MQETLNELVEIIILKHLTPKFLCLSTSSFGHKYAQHLFVCGGVTNSMLSSDDTWCAQSSVGCRTLLYSTKHETIVALNEIKVSDSGNSFECPYFIQNFTNKLFLKCLLAGLNI